MKTHFNHKFHTLKVHAFLRNLLSAGHLKPFNLSNSNTFNISIFGHASADDMRDSEMPRILRCYRHQCPLLPTLGLSSEMQNLQCPSLHTLKLQVVLSASSQPLPAFSCISPPSFHLSMLGPPKDWHMWGTQRGVSNPKQPAHAQSQS